MSPKHQFLRFQMSHKAKFPSVGLLLATAMCAAVATAAMVNPNIDNPADEWCYLAKSTTVIGVPNQPDVVQVTYDGALYTGQAELCFFFGAPLQPVFARQKTFLDGWIPVVQCDWQSGNVNYAVEFFSAVLDGESTSNALQFAKVTLTNHGSQPTNAILVSACRGSGEDCRFGTPQFDSNAVFAITNNALIRNGSWLYGFEAGAQQLEAVSGTPYSQPFAGSLYHLTSRMEVALAHYIVSLQPGESKTLHFKMPRLPVPVTNQTIIDKIMSANYDNYRSNTVAMWQKLVGSACHISLPEARVEQAYRASVVHVLLATRSRYGITFQTDGLPYPDCYQWAAFDYQQIYDTMQLPDFPKANLAWILWAQGTNGGYFVGAHGPVFMALASHVLYMRDQAYAASVYPNIQRGVSFIAQQHHANPNGLLDPSFPYDNEMIQGCYTSHNLWALAALRKCICVARLMGNQQDVTNWTALHDSYEKAVSAAIGSSAAADGYVPTGLGAFQTGPATGWPEYNTDQDWENVFLAWPSEALAPSDFKITGTLQRLHATRFHEGIMSYRNGMHLHQYITVNPMMQEVVGGHPKEALVDLYHTLLHCGSTHESFENMVEPWQDRLLSLSPYVPTPHAWGAAKLAGAIRNMLVMEYGGRLGLDAGQRDLLLFSVVSPAWATPGQSISVTNAGTEFGVVSAAMSFRQNGARVGITNAFISHPHNIVIRIPYFVTNISYQSDALSACLTNNTLQLSSDVTRVDFTWEVISNFDRSFYQDLLLAYRREPPFWSGTRAQMPALPTGFLTTDEQKAPALPLSFATIQKAYQHEYGRLYADFISKGGLPTRVAAPLLDASIEGTILHYGFRFTSGTLKSNGGLVEDQSPLGNVAATLTGTGGTFTNDIPDYNSIQNATGIGSLNLAAGAITTDPSGALSGHGIVTWQNIISRGGLTLESWVKGGGDSGIVLAVAAEFSLEATPGGLIFFNGFRGTGPTASLDKTQWHHVAGIVSNPVLQGSTLKADLQLYIDGQLASTYPGSIFDSDLGRAATMGNHPLVNSVPGHQEQAFTGTIYEPRITLGVLNPSQFTWKAADLNAVAYDKAAGITSKQEILRVSQFMLALKNAGLWDSLQDGVLLRTNFQSSPSNPVSLRGALGTNFGARAGADGLTFSGGQYALWKINPSSTCTVYTVLTTVTNPTFSTAFNLVSSGGVIQCARSLDLFPAGGAILYERQGASITNQNVLRDRNTTPIYNWDPRRHSMAFASDNHGGTFGWLDGSYSQAQSLHSSVTISSPLDYLMLGARLISPDLRDNYFYGTIELCLVFNTVLSTEQLKQVESAVRWLDPRPENIIFCGDSRTEWLADAGRGFTSYPYQLMNQPAMRGTAAWWQEGASGRPTFGLEQLYSDLVKPRAPGGPVTKSTLFLWGGVNDFLLTVNDATSAFNSLSNVCAMAKGDQFVVWIATEPKPDPDSWHAVNASYWTSTMESNRVVYNGLIRSNYWIADGLFNREALLPNMAASAGISNDGLHPNAAGNRLIAEQLRTALIANPRVTLSQLPFGQLGLAASGGRPGGLFQVLKAIDVTGPSNVWNCTETNFFDSSGSSTTTIDQQLPHVFYKVVIP